MAEGNNAFVDEALNIELNPDNVLAVAKTIREQIDGMKQTLSQHADGLIVHPPGGDQISMAATACWNTVISESDSSYLKQIEKYIENLNTLLIGIRKAIGKFQLSEAEKEQIFKEFLPEAGN